MKSTRRLLRQTWVSRGDKRRVHRRWARLWQFEANRRRLADALCAPMRHVFYPAPLLSTLVHVQRAVVHVPILRTAE